mmetsp:Transcript_12611/g.21312  ORF Transcript_12611/g.21312 Transcript_12611/m.21312 type:complete len:226 (+) Transcript_12611:40-717(+)
MSTLTISGDNLVSLENGEDILHTQGNVTLAVSVGDEVGAGEGTGVGTRIRGSGTLVVTNSRVVWVPENTSCDLFEFASVALAMHAVTQEGVESFPRPCLYCQLDESAGHPSVEAYFAPTDSASLDACFRALSQTAMMNPPPGDDEDDNGGMFGEDGFEGFGEIDGGFVALREANSDTEPPSEEIRAAMLSHLDSILQVSSQFEQVQIQDSVNVPPGDPPANADGP